MTPRTRSGFVRFAVVLTMAMALIGSLVGSVGSALAGTTVSYNGQGLYQDEDGSWFLNRELCGTANGADVDGPYLLWILTANGADSATIYLPDGSATMTKQKSQGVSTFKYVSGWYEPNDLINFGVYAVYEGTARGNVQLTISHGCRPAGNGWCSPGFWRNAQAGAWALVGKSPTDAFDGFVYDYWFGNSLSGVTLQTVLNNPQTYSGPPVPGTSGYQLNAYNATGAALTDLIPGFQFDFSLIGQTDACPIDHFGNFK